MIVKADNYSTKKTKILMCGSDLSVKGGIVSVVKNHLSYRDWSPYEIRYIPTHVDSSRFKVAAVFAAGWLKVVVAALSGRYKVLYLHTAERGSFFRKAILAWTIKALGMKIVMHHHAAEFEEFYAGLPDGAKRFVNKTLEKVDLNLVLSERLVDMITSKAPAANVKVLYNAVQTYEANLYDQDANYILFLGRIGKRKGAYDLLEAIKQLDSVIDAKYKFLLCGDGEVDQVRELAEEYGLRDRIIHIGWIEGQQKAEFLSRTMINVLPSYHEGLPMTILETMALGIPNISTPVASIPEVIEDGINGLLVEPGDVEQLAAAIKRLCEDCDLRMAISDQAWKEIVERFSLDIHVSKLKEYLEEM